MRQSALSLQEAGLLREFWTCINWDEDSLLAPLLPGKIRRQLARRAFVPGITQLIHTHPWREAGRLLSQTLGLKFLTKHEVGVFSVDSVFQSLDRRVAKHLIQAERLDGVYAGEDAAYETFRVAKRLGLKCFYDLPIAYWVMKTELLDEEAERWPAWDVTLGSTQDSLAKMERKTEELSLADVVFVPSQFVMDSLPRHLLGNKTCHVVEFGSPNVSLPLQDERDYNTAQSRPLRVLFAGSMTQRKGLADVFAAMRLLNRADVELVVMGSLLCPMEFYRRQFSGFRYEAPRPHSEVLGLMRSCDILVLPSIVEGRAMVQQEAMVCGLPLIVTPNAGGEDLIDEGKTGFLIPIRSPESIAQKIAWFADHRDSLPSMRLAANNKALEYTWPSYGEKIAHHVAAGISEN